jgi:GNAT superfamily N-acetyltransferase
VLLHIQRQAAVAAFGHIFPQDRYPFPDAAVRESWVSALADPVVEISLARSRDEPIGSLSVGHDLLRTLFVVPEHWGAGVGSALHDLALERLRAMGTTEARLWTLADNPSARPFYERRGWTTTGATRVAPFPPNPLEVEYARPVRC